MCEHVRAVTTACKHHQHTTTTTTTTTHSTTLSASSYIYRTAGSRGFLAAHVNGQSLCEHLYTTLAHYPLHFRACYRKKGSSSPSPPVRIFSMDAMRVMLLLLRAQQKNGNSDINHRRRAASEERVCAVCAVWSSSRDLHRPRVWDAVLKVNITQMLKLNHLRVYARNQRRKHHRKVINWTSGPARLEVKTLIQPADEMCAV